LLACLVIQYKLFEDFYTLEYTNRVNPVQVLKTDKTP
jgi:hypothetical protein